MNSTEAKKKQVVDRFIEKIKQESFVAGYTASDAEALGLLVSQYLRWDGAAILEATGVALEDANFHPEADAVRNLAQKKGV